MMLQRLNQFPEDLEDFFQHMIETIPPLYQRQAVRTFIITMSAPEPLLLTLHAFLDYIEDDPEFFLKRTQILEETELIRMHERMRRQLEGRTKGLLEVVSDPSTKLRYFQFSVDFLHRTVRDFLQSSSKVQSFMTNGQKELSDSWVLLCRGILSTLKHAPFGESLGGIFWANDPLERFLVEFVYFADKALRDPNNESAVIALFQEMQSTRTANDIHGLFTTARLQGLVCEHGILSLFRHMSYDWSTISQPVPRLQPLLWTALFDFKGGAPQQLDVVTYLLDKGADPNQKWQMKSHFQAYMQELYVAKEVDRHNFQIVAALVAHGADLSAVVAHTDDCQITGRNVISTIFPPEWASMILEGSSTRKREHEQETEQPSTSGRKTQAASRGAVVRSWFRQRLGWKSR